MHIAPALLACALALASPAGATRLSDYLPDAASYDPAVPAPSAVLGFEVGEWHPRPEQQVEYLRALAAAASHRVRFRVQGHTHERRPQPLLVVTSPENHARLDDILARHQALADPRTPAPNAAALADLPAVVLLGYSVHGNEASGASAALLVAYHFAAARSEAVTRELAAVVLLIDPSLNPDGLARFAGWVNAHRALGPLVGDAQSREHLEVWPGGRGNHYWFDLNRDWLLLRHPESRARLETLRRYAPNLVGDFHEMDTDSTFFFQPGVPERRNPLIPQRNVELTQALADGHARALAPERRLFFTQETFDDFYPGKGSTYPDLLGAVGVLFEQASARGHLQDSQNGPLAFSYGIENHLLGSLSMVAGAAALRGELLTYRAQSVRDAYAAAGRDARAAYLVGFVDDRWRLYELDDFLLRHGIEVHALARPFDSGGLTFDPAWSRVVPAAQPRALLVRTLFERATEFTDITFYDVSTWTLPLAFGARAATLDARALAAAAGAPIERAAAPRAAPAGDHTGAYAYLFDWSSAMAPRALARLLRAGVGARVATAPFEADTEGGRRRFARGAIVVPLGLAENRGRSDWPELLAALAEDGITAYTASSGLTPAGIDLGSEQLRALAAPRPALLVGSGVSSSAGELWHLLDERYRVPLVLLEVERLTRSNLARYTHLLLPDGGYERMSEEAIGALRAFVRQGGVLIAIGGGALFAERAVLERKPPAEDGAAAGAGAVANAGAARRAYASYEGERAAQAIAGCFLQVELDLTHPLAYGYSERALAVFRATEGVLLGSTNPYENVAYYADPPLLSGYLSAENRARLTNKPALFASSLGQGLVIGTIDNPNFRSYTLGTQRLLANALFFSPAILETSAPGSWP